MSQTAEWQKKLEDLRRLKDESGQASQILDWAVKEIASSENNRRQLEYMLRQVHEEISRQLKETSSAKGSEETEPPQVALNKMQHRVDELQKLIAELVVHTVANCDELMEHRFLSHAGKAEEGHRLPDWWERACMERDNWCAKYYNKQAQSTER